MDWKCCWNGWNESSIQNFYMESWKRPLEIQNRRRLMFRAVFWVVLPCKMIVDLVSVWQVRPHASLWGDISNCIFFKLVYCLLSVLYAFRCLLYAFITWCCSTKKTLPLTLQPKDFHANYWYDHYKHLIGYRLHVTLSVGGSWQLIYNVW
jgi:hypothetical protein